jgi:exodeoxyribonuclease VII small subunit
MSQKKSSTIQQQINELTAIIEWFENDDFEIEQAIEKFNEASKLATTIEESLAQLKNTVTIIKKDFTAS